MDSVNKLQAVANKMTNTELRAKLMAAKAMLGSVYQLRHFAAYTVDYERQCMTGHYYRLQYLPAEDTVILIDLHPSADNSTKHFD